jgi:alpha-L-arabinofuranosidase
VLVTVVNQDPEKAADLRLSIRGVKPKQATAATITGDNVRAEKAVQSASTIVANGDVLVSHLPARSVQAIRVSL